MYGGYAALNYSFLASNAEVNCVPHPDPARSSCGGINPMQTVSYALNGTLGPASTAPLAVTATERMHLSDGRQEQTQPCEARAGSHSAFPCAVAPWSAVVPKQKLVYAVGWYNMQHNLKHPTARDTKLGSSPSFCATVPLATC